nr:MAG TPA: hypothetical protein [Caudoviricetes sp.]
MIDVDGEDQRAGRTPILAVVRKSLNSLPCCQFCRDSIHPIYPA